MKKNFFFVLLGTFLGTMFLRPSQSLADQIKSVIVENFPEVQKVEVVNNDNIQKWRYWYQCHPNPANENEIRGYLNDRGQQGWEVIAAAGANGLICEYYKMPITE